MVEQVCHFEEYRKAGLPHEGRVLGSGEAVAESIGKHAALFPDLHRTH